MQQRMLSGLFLQLSLALSPWAALAVTAIPTTVHAQQISSIAAKDWLNDKRIQAKVDELMTYAIKDEVDSLSFALARIKLPQQEVTRFLLLHRYEQQHITLTDKMAQFIQTQLKLVPVYRTLERGDGYEFTTPAFDFPAVANRLLKQWQQDQQKSQFVLRVEQHNLSLQQWLTDNSTQQSHETLLIQELRHLSPSAVNYLVQQVASANFMDWLPSSAVISRLAEVSQQESMYKLLWRIRADHNSRSALKHLATIGDKFSQQQIMNATRNPSLKPYALTLLTQVDPLPEHVKQFLISKMAIKEEAPFVASALVRQGHRHWLQELLRTNKQIHKAMLEKVLQ